MKFKSFALSLLTVLGLLFTTSSHAADSQALMEPVKSVLDHYIMIQTELAKDSIKGLSSHTDAIAKAVKGDSMKMLSPDVAKQAETLGKTKDLKAARAAFKPLSDSLIKYVVDNKAEKGPYREAYCPMAKAGWLQTDKEIKNPYMGSDMLDCGSFKVK
ncbi:MAG: hypothetical protein JWM04_955 [Verrucomicrobiales bacterium]|nr:hypothetical protein [Verrucomicrobiales bacterium]